MPRVDLQIPFISMPARTRNTQISDLSKMAAGKIYIHRQIRRFSWISRTPVTPASPTANLGLIFYYQL